MSLAIGPTICPLCFAPLSASHCAACGADLQAWQEAQQQEQLSDAEVSLAGLHHALRRYEKMQHPVAVGRLLLRLADESLRRGEWQNARLYLEQILAQGEQSGNRILQGARRRLGGLLGRSGQLALGRHLLQQAYAGGDEAALLELMRLAIQQQDYKSAATYAETNFKAFAVSLEAAAWLAEALTRGEDAQAGLHVSAMMGAASLGKMPRPLAIATRALGLWQASQGDHAAAYRNLNAALTLFHQQRDLYETARTQFDLAQALLLEPATMRRNMLAGAAYVLEVQRLLGMAVSRFARLGAHPAERAAADLLDALTIGRGSPRPAPDDTTCTLALIWLRLDVPLSAALWASLEGVARHQGAIAERRHGGFLLLLGLLEPLDDYSLVIETLLALDELLRQALPSPAEGWALAAGLGLLPTLADDVVATLRAMLKSALFRRVQVQAGRLRPGQIAVDEMLAASTSALYTFSPSQNGQTSLLHSQSMLPPVAMLPAGQAPSPSEAPLLVGDPFRESAQQMLTQALAARSGAMLAVLGLPGTGKSRLLGQLLHHLGGNLGTASLRLAGEAGLQHLPFGAIMAAHSRMQGLPLPPAEAPPAERRRALIAGFRQHLLRRLTHGPLLLLVEDLHLLDSASLDALHAILPLLETHSLLLLLSARLEDDAGWQPLLQRARQGIPQRYQQITLPPEGVKLRLDSLPDLSLEARRVLEAAAVLGQRASLPALRQLSGLRNLRRVLRDLHTTQFLAPTEDPLSWRFVQSAERDALYAQLPPSYRQLLHWYAYELLQGLAMPSHSHAHLARMPRIAITESLAGAAHAARYDAVPEMLHYYDRALSYQNADVGLVLARVDCLLRLEAWDAAAQTLRFLQDFDSYTPLQQAQLLYYRGRLHSEQGQMGQVFALYEQAVRVLRRHRGEDPALQNWYWELLYAQAQARFRHGDLELARAGVGAALALLPDLPPAQPWLARLWVLLAQIHHVRGELQKAQQAAERALTLRRAAGEQWTLQETLELYGNLLAETGQLSDALPALQEALALAEAVGDSPSVIRLRLRLADLAYLEGHFAQMASHAEAALHVARFAPPSDALIRSQVQLAEALGYQKQLMRAFYHAHEALRAAAQRPTDKLGATLAALGLVRVALLAEWYDAAQDALAPAYLALEAAPHPLLRLRVNLLQMEVALLRGDDARFQQALVTLRDLTPLLGEQFLQGQVALLLGQYRFRQQEWNVAAYEAEKALEIFRQQGAKYWFRQARLLLRQLAHVAPAYVRRMQRR